MLMKVSKTLIFADFAYFLAKFQENHTFSGQLKLEGMKQNIIVVI